MIHIKIQEEINECFLDVAIVTHSLGAFSLLLPSDSRWIKPLPLRLQERGEFILTISNWSYEESKVTEEGILIKTAFGEIENQAYFTWTEVMGILTKDMEPIFIRNFLAEKEQYSLKGLMKD